MPPVLLPDTNGVIMDGFLLSVQAFVTKNVCKYLKHMHACMRGQSSQGISSNPFAMASSSTLPASPCNTMLVIWLRDTGMKFLAHLSPALKASSFSLTSEAVVAAAISWSLAEIPNDMRVSIVTGSGTFLASSTSAKTSLST